MLQWYIHALADSFVVIGIPRHLDVHANKAPLVVTLRNVNSCLILLLLGCGDATIFPSPLGSIIPTTSRCRAALRNSIVFAKVVKHLASHSIGNYIKESPETYMWDLVTVKNSPSSGNRFDPREEHIFLYVLPPYLSALTYM